MKKKLVFIFLLVNLNLYSNGLPKDYYEIKSNVKQKQYFFNYLDKLIEKENLNIVKEREFVYKFLNTNILKINYHSDDFSHLLFIKEEYKIKNLFNIEEYLQKLDIIPPSLALSQAAVESGWGKSRFLKIANNIFGHWTYNPKIGILPKRRNPNDKHYIRVFKDLSHSIRKYMLNLNSNNAYKQFHKKRYQQRVNKKSLDSLILSQTLINYSGIGKEYLKILKNVILKNKLLKYDEKFYKKLKDYKSFSQKESSN